MAGLVHGAPARQVLTLEFGLCPVVRERRNADPGFWLAFHQLHCGSPPYPLTTLGCSSRDQPSVVLWAPQEAFLRRYGSLFSVRAQIASL